ncbi:AI-2E family transporter [Rhodococcus chondri]|uniref:AI-2E family transporter n=1 Tax=Rhodococcus chondri TaxID=3065941 RepID=A0ABU7JZA1_9NOCA|nr:AI-2E family transporter [Rhodococcus sp. CC-R104]MEE2035306.1 AI-2E family transporter [Rhodococcus sp. CC-R104]
MSEGPPLTEPKTGEQKPARKADRAALLGTGGLWLAKWSAGLVIIAAAAVVLGWIIQKMWVIVLPVALAIVVATILWPPTRGMTKRGVPPAAAAGLTLVAFFAIFAGIIAGIAPSVISQVPDLANKATEGINKVQDWVKGPPINLRDEQLDSAVAAVVERLQGSAASIAGGVFSGVTTAGSMLITLALVLVLTFFFIKDGPRFLPWLHRVSGSRAGTHLDEVLTRMWSTLGGFIRTQALVSLIDAVFIGIGLVILGVPLAPVLAILTFIGGFIPIVGAFVAGALAVLVALVANGFTTALIVLALIIAVQQIEGNVLQPVLQSKSMNLHAVVVLLAVTAGSSLFGIVGAFLAVPVAAVAAVVIRYLGEQIDKNSVETDPEDGTKALPAPGDTSVPDPKIPPATAPEPSEPDPSAPSKT